MAIPAGGTPSEVQTGDTVHVRGGQSVNYLTGAFVKTIDAATGLVTYQDSAGAEQTATLATGSGVTADQNAEVAKVRGITEQLGDMRTILRRGWRLSTAISLAVFDHTPTSDQASGATYATSHTFAASDADHVHIVLRLPTASEIRQYRVVLNVGAVAYRFAGGLFARAHTDATYGYWVFEIVNVVAAATLTLEEWSQTDAFSTVFDGETVAERSTVDASGFTGNLPTTTGNVQAALTTLDGLELDDEVHAVKNYSGLPAPSAEYEETLWWVENLENMFTVIPITVYGTGQIGSFEAVPSRADLHIVDNLPPRNANWAGQTVYDKHTKHFWMLPDLFQLGRWGQRTPQQALGPSLQRSGDTVHFLGEYASDAQAIAQLPFQPSSTEVFYVRTSDNTFRRLAGGYVAATDPSTFYEWRYATAYVRANPDGAAVATLRRLTVDDLTYDIEFTGSAVGLRDEFQIGDQFTSPISNNFTQNGNMYHAGSSGMTLRRVFTWVTNGDSSTRNFKHRVQTVTGSGNTERTGGAVLFETSDADQFEVQAGLNTAIETVFDPPIAVPSNGQVYIASVRQDADDVPGYGHRSTGTAATSTFGALTGFDKDITFIGAAEFGDRAAEMGTIGISTTLSFRQHVTYDMPIGATLADETGTQVRANVEVPGAQDVLETVLIDNEVYRVEAPADEGKITLVGSYTISEDGTSVDPSDNRTEGNFYVSKGHEFTFHEFTAEVTPEGVEGNYIGYFVTLTRVNATTYNITNVSASEQTRIVPADTTRRLTFSFNSPGGANVPATSYFGLLVTNQISGEGPHTTQRPNTGGADVEESSETAFVFEYVGRTQLAGVPADGNNVWRDNDFSGLQIVDYEVEIDRDIDFQHDGAHVQAQPEYVNFTGNVTVEPVAGSTGITVDIPTVMPQRLARTNVITSPMALTVNASSVALASAAHLNLTHAAIAKTDIEDLALTVQIDDVHYAGIVITREQLNDIGYSTAYSYTYTGDNRVPCVAFANDNNSSGPLEGSNYGPAHNVINAILGSFGLFMIFPLEDSGGANLVGFEMVGYNATGESMSVNVVTYRHA